MPDPSLTFWLIALAAAFLAGSIPFGLFIGLAKGIDVRQHGSKNIGATNVGRVLGTKYFFLCFALDLLKGFGPTFGAGFLSGATKSFTQPTAWAWLAVMLAAVLGHVFSPWLKFKGGKGVATSLGALLGVFPHLTVPGAAVFGLWLIVLGIGRYISVASIAAGLALPLMTIGWFATKGPISTGVPFIVVSVVLGALVVYKHRANMKRLREGTEPKVGQRATATTTTPK
jgi:acyl phosphate:glycerol-3-phosphate acyltransferase